MKKFLIITFFISISYFVLPISHAYGIYVREHNITYCLGEEDFLVEETIVFGNYGDPFTFEGKVSLTRGDAREIEIEGVKYEIISTPSTTIFLNLFINKGTFQTVHLRYRRSDMLSSEGNLFLFKGLALGKYPWDVHSATIKFITPREYYFGKISPTANPERGGEKEILTYRLTIFDNLTLIEDGFPVEIEYGRYREMAISEIRAAQEKISEAEYSIDDANLTLRKSKNFGCNLTESENYLNYSIKNLEIAKKEVKIAQVSFKVYKNYYLSYSLANSSREHATLASRYAKLAKDQINFEIQKKLEERIRNLSSANMSKPKIIIQQIPQREGGKGKLKFNVFYALLAIFAVFFLIVVAYRNREREERSSVRSYSSISNLKYGKFESFDKKIEIAKKTKEIAGEILRLRREKERYQQKIEEIKNKLMEKEIDRKEYKKLKEEIEKKIEDIDSKIIKLEEKLRDFRLIKKKWK